MQFEALPPPLPGNSVVLQIWYFRANIGALRGNYLMLPKDITGLDTARCCRLTVAPC